VVRDAKEEREKEGRKERRNGYSTTTTATNSRRKETIKLNVPYVKKFIFYVFYGFMAK
jgi:transposase-like protein